MVKDKLAILMSENFNKFSPEIFERRQEYTFCGGTATEL